MCGKKHCGLYLKNLVNNGESEWMVLLFSFAWVYELLILVNKMIIINIICFVY